MPWKLKKAVFQYFLFTLFVPPQFPFDSVLVHFLKKLNFCKTRLKWTSILHPSQPKRRKCMHQSPPSSNSSFVCRIIGRIVWYHGVQRMNNEVPSISPFNFEPSSPCFKNRSASDFWWLSKRTRRPEIHAAVLLAMSLNECGIFEWIWQQLRKRMFIYWSSFNGNRWWMGFVCYH